MKKMLFILLVSPFTMPFGWLVELLGRLTNRPYLICIGHYFGRSGLTIRLPAHYEMFGTWKKCKHNGRWKNVVANCSENGDQFYNAVGKAKMLATMQTYGFVDRYEFYPWCHDPDHYSGCDCHPDRRHWGTIELFDYNAPPKVRRWLNGRILRLEIRFSACGLKLELSVKLGRFNTYKERMFLRKYSFPTISMVLGITHISLFTSDRVFAYLGRPFHSYGGYRVSRLRYLALRREIECHYPLIDSLRNKYVIRNLSENFGMPVSEVISTIRSCRRLLVMTQIRSRLESLRLRRQLQYDVDDLF